MKLKEKLGIRINTLTKLFALIYLYDSPMHGYELMKRLNDTLPYKINPEQVYPFLHDLKERGYATISETGEREKKVYSLTDKGRGLVEYLMDRFGNILEIVIKPQLHICAHCGVKIIGEGYKTTVEGEELMFCCEHCAKHYIHSKMKVRKNK